MFSIPRLGPVKTYMIPVKSGKGKGRRGARNRTKPAYRCAIVGDLDILVQVQDRLALCVALRGWPDSRDGLKRRREKRNTGKWRGPHLDKQERWSLETHGFFAWISREKRGEEMKGDQQDRGRRAGMFIVGEVFCAVERSFGHINETKQRIDWPWQIQSIGPCSAQGTVARCGRSPGGEDSSGTGDLCLFARGDVCVMPACLLAAPDGTEFQRAACCRWSVGATGTPQHSTASEGIDRPTHEAGFR